MKIHSLISGCHECPHRVYYSGMVYECRKADQKLPSLESLRGGHPTWCPLPEYPAKAMANLEEEIANLRKALEAARKQ